MSAVVMTAGVKARGAAAVPARRSALRKLRAPRAGRRGAIDLRDGWVMTLGEGEYQAGISIQRSSPPRIRTSRNPLYVMALRRALM
jgi:hypothetical protein